MFTKFNLLGTLVGTISIIVLTLIFVSLYDSFLEKYNAMPEGFYRDSPRILFSILGALLMGFLLSTAFTFLRKELYTFWVGFQIGILFGAFHFFGFEMMMYAISTTYEFKALVVEGVFGIINIGISGGLIALIYRVMNK